MNLKLQKTLDYCTRVSELNNNESKNASVFPSLFSFNCTYIIVYCVPGSCTSASDTVPPRSAVPGTKKINQSIR